MPVSTTKTKERPMSKKPIPSLEPKLYIAIRKKRINQLVSHESELMSLHKNIKKIVLPRVGLSGKFFFAIFKSTDKALDALATLKKDEQYIVRYVGPKVKKAKETKSLEKKIMRQEWTS